LGLGKIFAICFFSGARKKEKTKNHGGAIVLEVQAPVRIKP
jgi:hypothetical protein